MKLLFVVLVLILPFSAFADLHLDNYGVGYGILSSGVFTQSVSENGESSVYGGFSLHFLDANISWAYDNNKYRYHIKGAYTLIPREADDGAADITQWRLSFLLGYEPTKKIRKKFILTSGLGVLGAVSKGNGGSVILNNGGGTTVFYRPSDTVNSNLLMLELGFTQAITNNVNYSIEALVNGLFGGRRTLNIYLSLNYFWDHGYKRRLKLQRQRENQLSEDDSFVSGKQKVKKKRKRKKRKRRRRKTN